MKKAFSNPLRQQFENHMRELDAGYEFFDVGKSHLFSSGFHYVKRLSLSDWLFVCLRLSPKGYNEFDLEFGWSCFGRVPQVMSRAGDLFHLGERFEEEKRLNIGEGDKGGTWKLDRDCFPAVLPPQGKLTDESVDAIVAQQLRDAVGKLSDVGFPILKEVEARFAEKGDGKR